MGWSNTPDMDRTSNQSNDNPFAGPKTPVPRKLSRLNIPVVEGYPSRSSEACKLNSSYSKIARQAGLSSTPPASRRISQETMRRWEKLADQTASFNRCLFKSAAGYASSAEDFTFRKQGQRFKEGFCSHRRAPIPY